MFRPETATKAARGLGWSVGGNLALRVLALGTNVVMARLVAPAEFGVFAVGLTVWLIVGTLAEFGLGSELIRSEDPEPREPTSATLAVGLSVTLACVMLAAADPLAAAFGSADSGGIIRLMSISTAVSGLAVVPSARLQRELRQRDLLVVNGAGSVAIAVVMLGLAAAGVGAAALAWGQIAGQVVIVVGCYLATRSLPRFGFVPDRARSSVAFCLPLAVANLISWLLLTVDNLVVARTLGPVQLGLYVLAFNVSSWPMTAIGQGLRTVALPAFADVPGRRRRARALVGVLPPVIAVAAPVAMALATLSAPVVDVVYGSRWAGAASALAGLAVFGGLRIVLDLLATFLIAAGETRAVLVVQVAWLVAMVPVMMVGTAAFGLSGAGWAHVAVAVAVVLPAYLVCLRRVDVHAADFLRAWVQPLAWLVPSTVLCWWLGGRSGSAAGLVAAGGLVVLLLYVAPSARWWLNRIRSLRSDEEGAVGMAGRVDPDLDAAGQVA